MIDLIKLSAQEVGIAVVVTNSEQGIETQLNSLTHKVERGNPDEPNTVTRPTDLPILLISWDIDTDLTFDTNGFLNNPENKIVGLLMKKASNLKKDIMEDASGEMSVLFHQFINNLNQRLVPFMRHSTFPITKCGYKRVPKYGAGKHSGVLVRWNMKTGLDVC